MNIWKLFCAIQRDDSAFLEQVLNHHLDEENEHCDVIQFWNKEMLQLRRETLLTESIQRRSINCVSTLLKYQADVYQRNEYGEIPIHLAILTEHAEIFKLILKQQANLEIIDFRGRTPLLQAMHILWFEAADLLVRNGANVNAIDNSGATPMSYAVRAKTGFLFVKLLIENGADVNHREGFRSTPLLMTAIGESTVDKLKVIRHLLENGANPRDIDIYCATMMEQCIMAPWDFPDTKVIIAQLLLEYGYPLNIQPIS